MVLTLVHTADIHRVTFDRLRDEIAPDVELRHIVRPRWLIRARDGITESLDAEITGTIVRCSKPVLCTCTTVGPVAEAAGALRVDWPMMQRAAQSNGPVLLAYCLESTYRPSKDLLLRAMDAAEVHANIVPVPLTNLWQHFEAGERDQFYDAIARDIRQTLEEQPKAGAVVLAQVSMAGAAERLNDLEVPVLSSPELAFRALLAAL